MGVAASTEAAAVWLATSAEPPAAWPFGHAERLALPRWQRERSDNDGWRRLATTTNNNSNNNNNSAVRTTFGAQRVRGSVTVPRRVRDVLAVVIV